MSELCKKINLTKLFLRNVDKNEKSTNFVGPMFLLTFIIEIVFLNNNGFLFESSIALCRINQYYNYLSNRENIDMYAN